MSVNHEVIIERLRQAQAVELKKYEAADDDRKKLYRYKKLSQLRTKIKFWEDELKKHNTGEGSGGDGKD